MDEEQEVNCPRASCDVCGEPATQHLKLVKSLPGCGEVRKEETVNDWCLCEAHLRLMTTGLQELANGL